MKGRMMTDLKILHNYQQGTKNAKVYKTGGKQYAVLMYESTTDYNSAEFFNSEEDAENRGEDFVMGA
jgi:hypothetical protein